MKFIINTFLIINFILFSGCYALNKDIDPVLETPTPAQPIITLTQTDVTNLSVQKPKQVASLSVQKTKQVVSIIGVGDIMLGTNYPSKKYLPVNKGKNLLKTLNHILKDADVTFGNLEGTILNKGTTIKNCAKCYAFRMPEYLADNLVTAGFDVMSIANNHVRDFGMKGINNTIKILRRKGIKAAGIENKLESTSFEKQGIKYGFAAFAPNIGTVKITNIAKAKTIVQNLAQTNDIVIVSFHGGAEGVKHQRVTRKTETFYGENRGNVYKFAHAVIDAGADIVFGHGPHVTRAVEVYKDRFIAYSLGNFCTYGRFKLSGATAIAPIIKVNVNRKGVFKNAKITPIVQIKNKRVQRDNKNRAIKIIQKLTKRDKFDHNIQISNQGLIRKK